MANDVLLNPGEDDEVLVATEEALHGIQLAHVQMLMLVGVSGGSIITSPIQTALTRSRSQETFTVTGTGPPVDVSTVGRQHFSLQVSGTGATPDEWTVELQVSNDGVKWATLLTHTEEDGDGAHLSEPSAAPADHFRVRCTALDLGSATNIVVTAIAK